MADIAQVLSEEKQSLRKSKQAPCAYESFNSAKKQNEIIYPSVSCSFDCAHCGWNPVVRKARIDKMSAEVRANRKKEVKK